MKVTSIFLMRARPAFRAALFIAAVCGVAVILGTNRAAEDLLAAEAAAVQHAKAAEQLRIANPSTGYLQFHTLQSRYLTFACPDTMPATFPRDGFECLRLGNAVTFYGDWPPTYRICVNDQCSTLAEVFRP